MLIKLGMINYSEYISGMIIYVLTINGIVQDRAFTSLFGICQYYNISYGSASKGKRQWADRTISTSFLTKIKGRGRRRIG